MPSASLRRCRPLLGTFVEITVHGRAAILLPAITRAFAAIERVQGRMSVHDAGSDIGRLNRTRPGSPVRVHPQTWRVLARAQRLAQATDGAFDVTVGGDLVRWGLLPGTTHPPARRGFRDLVLLPGHRVSRRLRVIVDLGGIAKGFAVDEAVRALRSAGVRSGCVNAGGDLRAFGARAFPVALRVPGAPGLVATMVSVRNEALATSGGYLRRRRVGGRLVTPLVHPGTGRALAPFTGVTVRARTCMAADALTKVVLAGAARAPRLLGRHHAQALLLDRAGRARPFIIRQPPEES
jgi:thiamine biosynthesis lipoprotein